MPQRCTICTHPDRAAIDKALVIEKSSFRDIARQWRVSKDAVARHQAHIPKALAKAQSAKEVADADTLLGEVRTAQGRSERLYSTAEDILERALQAKDLRTALRAIDGAVDVMREARASLELKGKLTGELGTDSVVPRQVMIVLPAKVPVGSPCDLNAEVVPPPEFDTIDAEFEDVPAIPAVADRAAGTAHG